jgi:hypothetical protein
MNEIFRLIDVINHLLYFLTDWPAIVYVSTTQIALAF